MGRAQGTFKDPNVFASFLIPPFIFLAQDQLFGKMTGELVDGRVFDEFLDRDLTPD